MGSSLNQSRKRPVFNLRAGSFVIPLGRETKVMGIINVTPDSFSADGLLRSGKDKGVDRAVRLAEKMVADGADILDIGGESSRPGAQPITAALEIKRIIPILKILVKKFKVPVSVDTYKEDVVRAALDQGASIINSIMGTQASKSFFKIIAPYQAAVVLMHMKGNPQTMQRSCVYKNLVGEIISSLRKSVEICLESGIKSDRIIIDPGIGFAKSAQHNFEIINRLSEFGVLRKPVLIGTSRKSFIGKIIHKDAADRLFGSLATVSSSVYNGAHIVRVHDVRETRDTVDVTDAILNPKKIK